MAKTISKHLTKAQVNHYRQMLEQKAVELRKNMLAPAAASGRRECLGCDRWPAAH